MVRLLFLAPRGSDFGGEGVSGQGSGGAVEGKLAYILHIILRRFRFLLSLSQEASKTKHAPV